MFRLVPVVLAAAACFAAAPERPLDGLRASHPRLIALDSDIARVRSLIKTDARSAALYASVKQSADGILDAPPVVHRLIGPLPIGNRGELAVLYFFVFVYMLFRGGGKYSLDRVVRKRP